MTRYFPRSSAVKATQLTAKTSEFILAFNHERTGYPWAMDNGKGIFIITGPGIVTEIPVGAWAIETADGVIVRADDSFTLDFCPAA